MATPAWRASTAPAGHRGLSAFSRRAIFWTSSRCWKGPIMPLMEEGRRQPGLPEPRFAAVRSSAKRWQKVGGVGAGWDARWRSSRCSWCAPPAAPGSGAAVRLSWAGCNKYAPQKTAGLPAAELQKVLTHFQISKTHFQPPPFILWV